MTPNIPFRAAAGDAPAVDRGADSAIGALPGEPGVEASEAESPRIVWIEPILGNTSDPPPQPEQETSPESGARPTIGHSRTAFEGYAHALSEPHSMHPNTMTPNVPY